MMIILIALIIIIDNKILDLLFMIFINIIIIRL
jgi:hypothetical protein